MPVLRGRTIVGICNLSLELMSPGQIGFAIQQRLTHGLRWYFLRRIYAARDVVFTGGLPLHGLR